MFFRRRKRRLLIVILAALALAFAARVAPVTQTGAVRLEMVRMGYVKSAIFSKLERFYPYGEGKDGGFLASYRPVTLVPYSKMIYNEPLDQWNVYSKSGWFYKAAFGHC
ncbi:MAG: hypothetical protein LBB75_00185 [Oscillospiraceae bacterium]|jgi:hypothetical protein|nr:hypothetical protein [Oscillospiraceae bacterium]